MSEKKELSGLARQILSGGGHITLYTQQEFDEAMAIAKAEIMTIAIETTKTALKIEREACADLVEAAAAREDEGEISFVLKEVAEDIRNRIPSQRQ